MDASKLKVKQLPTSLEGKKHKVGEEKCLISYDNNNFT
jgi:hypothetical protein